MQGISMELIFVYFCLFFNVDLFRIKAHLRSFHGKDITDEEFDKMHPKKNIIRDRDMGFQSDEDILGGYLGNTGELEVLNDGIVFDGQTNFAMGDYFDN